MSRIGSLLIGALLFIGLQAQATTPQIRNVLPSDHGKLSVQIHAASIYQYTPVIMCDSYDFQLRHFSSFYRAGRLFVELNYRTYGMPWGASCSLFFVEDDLKEFDFETGQPLLSGPESFKFVIQ